MYSVIPCPDCFLSLFIISVPPFEQQCAAQGRPGQFANAETDEMIASPLNWKNATPLLTPHFSTAELS